MSVDQFRWHHRDLVLGALLPCSWLCQVALRVLLHRGTPLDMAPCGPRRVERPYVLRGVLGMSTPDAADVYRCRVAGRDEPVPGSQHAALRTQELQSAHAVRRHTSADTVPPSECATNNSTGVRPDGGGGRRQRRQIVGRLSLLCSELFLRQGRLRNEISCSLQSGLTGNPVGRPGSGQLWVCPCLCTLLQRPTGYPVHFLLAPLDLATGTSGRALGLIELSA